MNLRDIRWVGGQFGLTYGMIGTHRVATIEQRSADSDGPPFLVHLWCMPILGERTRKLAAHSLEEGKLIGSLKIVQHINHFTEEIRRHAQDEEATAA